MDTNRCPAFLPAVSSLRGSGSLLLGVLVFGVLVGCSQFSSDPKPLPDSTFTRLLTELHLAGARERADAPYPRGLRDSIFARYGVRRTAFEATLKYYSHRPEAFEALYQPVLDTLMALQHAQRSPSTPTIPDSIASQKGQYMPNR